MPMWDGGPEPPSTRRSPMSSSHFGAGSSLVDEDQMLGIEVQLAFEPGVTARKDVGTTLLRSMG